MARTVLFSNSEIASYINENFEAVWQSVREVPVVSIDFGNGRSIKRTLNGNVASYVCRSNGQVLDVLPGVYEPQSYKDRLEQLVLLNRYMEGTSGNKMDAALMAYHRQQWHRLERGKSPARFVEKNGELVLSSKADEPVKKWSKPLEPESAYRSTPLPKAELAQWEQLLDDVRYNETEMRMKIHARLSRDNSERIGPTVTYLSKWLYRDVLHADIDDPYLGLKSVLDGSYPFDMVKKTGGS